MYINRKISEKILTLSKQFPAIVLTGARQVGKSTLLKELFPSYHYVSLDLPSLAELAEQEPQVFLKQYPTPLIVDEVQYAPGLFRHLKIAIDSDRHNMGQIILTGSQKFVLMKEVSDSLAGRAAILDLECLTLGELELNIDHDWTKILYRGFYPELWRQKTLDAASFYASYLASYLERDVRQILKVQNLRDFERFMRSCAARSAQLLNLSELARDVGIKSQTARDWLSVLEASNQVSLLEPYFENVGKRIVKSPKLYIHDPGLLCYLLGFEENTLNSTPLIGAVWETFIYSEFRKQRSNLLKAGNIWYYRDAQGREIDFITTNNGCLDLFECKCTENPDSRWISNLQEVQAILAKSKTYGIGTKHLLCRISNPVKRDTVQLMHPVDFFHPKI